MASMKVLFAIMLVLVGAAARGERFVLPPPDVDLVGMVRQVRARENEDLLDIGRQFGIGMEAMKNANPDVDVWAPGAGTKVLIPSRYILPDVPRTGIVINLPEMRLYYYPEDEEAVYVFAIGIGREGWDTPLGTQKISEKIPDPTWTPPASIRAEHEKDGDPLPEVVPAGVDNPLGLFAMRLSDPSYLIHGTNKPWGVGMRVSHGCIRLYPEGIEKLFAMVAAGTSVNIIKEEMKLGWYGDQLYLEYHPPIEEDHISLPDAMRRARTRVNEKVGTTGLRVADALIRAVVREASGMPVSVAYRQAVVIERSLGVETRTAR